MSKTGGYALVLGGGGAKGSYQVGAWKALREFRIPIQAVSGASVGALNAALIAQGEPDLAEEIWEKIRIDNVVDVPAKMIKNGKIALTKEFLTDFEQLTAAWSKGLLLDSTPLKKLIRNYVNEESIRKGKIDLGVVTINRTDFKPLEIFLDDMEEGYLGDYLLASASFPAFKRTEIKGKKFIDGGLHDNIPFGMMKNRGYRRFIIMDISGLGNNRQPVIEGTETIYIKNSINMGGILDFDPVFLKKYRLLGYLDTQKILGGNEGFKYFYKPSRIIENKLTKLSRDPGVREIIREYGGEPALEDLRNILPQEYRLRRDPIPGLIECAALALRLERVALYEMDDLLSLIWNSRQQMEKVKLPVERPLFQDFFSSLTKRIKEINPEKLITQFSPQEYLKTVEVLTGKTKSTLEKNALFKLFPELPAAQVFFGILNAYYGE